MYLALQVDVSHTTSASESRALRGSTVKTINEVVTTAVMYDSENTILFLNTWLTDVTKIKSEIVS